MRRPSSPPPDGGHDRPSAGDPGAGGPSGGDPPDGDPAAGDDDPFGPVDAPPRLATPLALLGFVLGLVAAVGGLAPVAGPVGMAVGLIAHVKGSRLGMPAAVVAALGMLVGMTIALYLR